MNQLSPHKRYSGGKGGSGVYQALINLIPPVDTFISACVGNGGVERHLKLPSHTILNDINPDVYAGWLKTIKIPYYKGKRITPFNLHYKDLVDMLGLCDVKAEHQQKSVLIYFDIPYLLDSRNSGRKMYDYEFTYDDHVEFLRLVNKLQCLVLINHPSHIIYENSLSSAAGWHVTPFESVTSAGTKFKDNAWHNYPAPDTVLQDYRYLGTDYRQRELIKKRLNSLQRKFNGLSKLEQAALLQSLNLKRNE